MYNGASKEARQEDVGQPWEHPQELARLRRRQREIDDALSEQAADRVEVGPASVTPEPDVSDLQSTIYMPGGLRM